MSTFFDAEDVHMRASADGPPSPELTRCVVDQLLKKVKQSYRRGAPTPIRVMCADSEWNDMFNIATAEGYLDDWNVYKQHDAAFYTTWARELERVARAVSGLGSTLTISFVEAKRHRSGRSEEISSGGFLVEVSIGNHTPA